MAAVGRGAPRLDLLVRALEATRQDVCRLLCELLLEGDRVAVFVEAPRLPVVFLARQLDPLQRLDAV